MCCCHCHGHARGRYKAALQHGNWPETQDAARDPMLNVQPSVDVTDVLEAAMACPLCLKHHVPALSIRAIWGERREKAEWTDSPPRKDDGEGAE